MSRSFRTHKNLSEKSMKKNGMEIIWFSARTLQFFWIDEFPNANFSLENFPLEKFTDGNICKFRRKCYFYLAKKWNGPGYFQFKDTNSTKFPYLLELNMCYVMWQDMTIPAVEIDRKHISTKQFPQKNVFFLQNFFFFVKLHKFWKIHSRFWKNYIVLKK